MAITQELCEALSGLDYNEWQVVRTAMDDAMADSAARWLEGAKAARLASHGPVRCELTGPQLLGVATADR